MPQLDLQKINFYGQCLFLWVLIAYVHNTVGEILNGDYVVAIPWQRRDIDPFVLSVFDCVVAVWWAPISLFKSHLSASLYQSLAFYDSLILAALITLNIAYPKIMSPLVSVKDLNASSYPSSDMNSRSAVSNLADKGHQIRSKILLILLIVILSWAATRLVLLANSIG